MKMIETPGSSSIHSYGYEPESETLGIRFHTGKLYHYKNVPARVCNFMYAADSAGKYVNLHIKGKYEHKFIEEKK